MTDAYNHASVGQYSPEVVRLQQIDRFGLEAITGRRQFYYGELRRLIIADNIVKAFHSRAHATNWAEWTRDNPIMAELLAKAERLIND